MKSILGILLALCLLAPSVEAKPHPKLKKIAIAVYIIGVPAAMATWNTVEVSRARKRAGIEKAETGYGNWKAMQIIYHIGTDLIGPLITYKVKHIEEENGECKTWYFLPAGTAAANAYMAVNQRSKQPDRNRDPSTHCRDGKKFNGFGCEE